MTPKVSPDSTEAVSKGFEKETVDALRRLTRDVKELREEIRGETLAERTRSRRMPSLPTEENRRLRQVIDPTDEPKDDETG